MTSPAGRTPRKPAVADPTLTFSAREARFVTIVLDEAGDRWSKQATEEHRSHLDAGMVAMLQDMAADLRSQLADNGQTQ